MEVQRLKILLGKHLRELRMERGLSQQQLAALSGLHRTYIGHVERANANISLSSLCKFANALQLDIKDLFNLRTSF